MPPTLRMKPFRNKGDVKRMMQRLMGAAARDMETFDPVTIAAFLTKSDSFPGAFSIYRNLLSVVLPNTWEWWRSPASSIIQNPAGVSVAHESFWNPGQGILPPTDEAAVPIRSSLSGWYFTPDHISIRFYTTLDVAKAGLVDIIQNFGMYLSERTPATVSPFDSFILAQCINVATREVQHFSTSPVTGTGASCPSTHALFPMPLLVGQTLQLSGFNGLIIGDNIAINMTGLWRFNPRFIDDSEERNG